VSRDDAVTAKSVRNLPELHVLWPDQLNTYDVLCSDDVVFTRDALEEFVRRSTLPKGARSALDAVEPVEEEQS
jgi:large subunit ribosomal protein L4